MHAASLFNFEGDALGTYTAFTNVNNGLSATFTSNGDPGGFVVDTSFFSSLTGNVLLDPGPAGDDQLSLTVSFSSQVSSASLDFAINPITPTDTFTLAAYQGSTLVGSDTETGSVPSGSFYYPEGVASFNGALFNSIVLSSSGEDLAVDNISVSAATTPEPGTMSIVGLAVLAGFGIGYRRKRMAL